MALRFWSKVQLAVLAGSLLAGRAAHAEEQEAQKREVEAAREAARETSRRAVARHLFTVSPLAPAPLATTYFSSRTILGVAEGEGRVYDLGTGADVGTAEQRLAALSERMDLQIAPLRWLAVRAGIAGTVYTGIETRSALALGATVRYEPTLGATASMALGEAVRIGASFDYALATRYNVNIVRPIVESIGERRVVTRSIVTDDRVSVFVPGASAAVALSRAVGLVASAQYRREEGGDDIPGVAAENALAGGLALDLDLEPISPVPLGFLLAYRLTEPLGDEDIARTHELDGGIDYTGRPELELGLEIGLRRFPLFAGVPADAALGTVAMRYYW